MSTQSVLLSIRHVCQMTNLGRSSIYRLIGAGRLTALKIGRRTVIPASSVEKFLADLSPAKIRTPNSG